MTDVVLEGDALAARIKADREIVIAVRSCYRTPGTSIGALLNWLGQIIAHEEATNEEARFREPIRITDEPTAQEAVT